MRYLAFLLLAACPGHGVTRDKPDLSVAQVIERMTKARDALTSFTADSVMDYWLGQQRAKGEVLVMGTPGAHLRIGALSPAGGSTLAELACDGASFAYVDHQNNCQLTGPCNEGSIASLLHVELAPGDFMPLALGTPPVLQTSDGTVTWDSDKGVERVTLKSGAGTQTIAIDDKGDHFDVVATELRDAGGRMKWSIENQDFVVVDGHRLPGKTRFKTPDANSDLIVEWGERQLNKPIDEAKFKIPVPDGLAQCGAKPPAHP